MPSLASKLTLAAAAALVVSDASAAPDASSDLKVTVNRGRKKCKAEDRVRVGSVAGFHYTASVDESSRAGEPGKKIESSLDRGVAPSFPIGEGRVIRGLDDGMVGLCKGAEASIVIPPHLAYGDVGNPPHLPGGVTLRYDVEILDVQPPVPNDFVKIDANRDGKVSREEAEDYFESIGQPVRLDELWEAEDKDKDGYISWEEFNGPKGRGPPPPPPGRGGRKAGGGGSGGGGGLNAQQANFVKEVEAMMFKLDTNKDGSISRSELDASFAKEGHSVPDALWSGMDADGDGSVSRGELAAFHGGQTAAAEEQLRRKKGGGNDEEAPKKLSPREENLRAFKMMDKDEDGKISEAELGDFFKSMGGVMPDGFWEESDRDKDGFVSWVEFIDSEDEAAPSEREKDEL